MENCCKFILIIIIVNIHWVLNGPDPVSAVPIIHPSIVVPKMVLYPQTYIKSTLIVRMRTLRLQETELSKVKWALGIWTWQHILVTNYLIKFTNLTLCKCKTCLLSHKVSQNKQEHSRGRKGSLGKERQWMTLTKFAFVLVRPMSWDSWTLFKPNTFRGLVNLLNLQAETVSRALFIQRRNINPLS